MSHLRPGLLTLLVILVISTLVVSSCNTGAPARFYVLTPLTLEPVPQPPAIRGVTIGVGPVELPQYVNRPHLVTGHEAPEIRTATVAEWAEPLRDGFTRVLADNLSRLLASERIAIFPWKTGVPEYQVVVDVTHFLGQTGGEVALVALWNIIGKHGNTVLVSKKSSFRVPTGAADYAALATAMSHAVAALSRDIAVAITALPPRTSAY